MDVELAIAEPALGHAELGGAGAGVGERGAAALLHHLAELAGEHQLALAGEDAGLDVHDVAAGGRVIHPGGHPGLLVAAPQRRVDLGLAQQRPHRAGRIHPHLARLAPGDAARGLAGDGGDRSLELPDTGLARVVGDDAAQGLLADLDLGGPQAVLLDLARQQVAPGDLHLLGLGVPGEGDGLHAVHERPGDGLAEVGGAEEEHLREVEGHAQVVVDEAAVLRRVEDLQQRRGRVALERDPELVDLVEEEHRVLAPRLLDAGEHPPRHRPHVGAPVAADVGLVAGAAQRDAHVRAPQRAGDRLGDGGLAGPRRAEEEQDRPARHRPGARLAAGVLGPQLAHGEELEDPILDVGEPEVVALQDAPRLGEVHVIVGARLPGQVGDPLQPGGEELRLRRGLATEPLEPAEIAAHLAEHLGGQARGGDAGLDPAERVAAVLLAQLLLDRLELLAQVELALPLADLHLDAGADLLLGLGDADLPGEVGAEEAELLLDRQRLEERLLLRRRQVQVEGDVPDQRARLLDGADELLQDLVGGPAAPPVLHRLLAHLPGERGDGARVFCSRRKVGEGRGGGEDDTFLLGVAQRRGPRVAAEHELEPHAEPLHLGHLGDHADGVQALRGRVLGGVALGDGEDVLVGALGAQRRLDGAERLEPTCGDRCRDRRKQHRLPQRDHGEREAFGHVLARLRDACHRAAWTGRADPAVRRMDSEGARAGGGQRGPGCGPRALFLPPGAPG